MKQQNIISLSDRVKDPLQLQTIGKNIESLIDSNILWGDSRAQCSLNKPATPVDEKPELEIQLTEKPKEPLVNEKLDLNHSPSMAVTVESKIGQLDIPDLQYSPSHKQIFPLQ